MSKLRDVQNHFYQKRSNLKRWATEKKYNYPTVHQAINRWGDVADREPHGAVVRDILFAIHDETEIIVCPGLIPHEGKNQTVPS